MSSPKPDAFALTPAGQLAANENFAQRTRSRTRRDQEMVQAFVEDFIRSRQATTYPVEDEDVADENRERGPQPSLKVAFEIEVARAFAKNAAPVTAVSPSFFAFQLLATTDASYGVALELLPREAMTPDRLLAHVLRLPVKLDKRVAASIARRLCLLLLNRTQYVGPRTEVSEPLPEPTISLPAIPAEPPPPAPVASVPAPEPEFCVECGSTYVGRHRCGEAAPAPLPARPPPRARPASPPAVEQAPPRIAERRVIGHVKTRVGLDWFFSMGIGKESFYVEMPKGTCLEVLEPDARDRQDQEWQVRHDKRQVVVVWWREKRRLVFIEQVDRVEKAEFEAYERERANAEAMGAAGSGDAGEGAGTDAAAVPE